MIELSPERIAAACGAEILAGGRASRPGRAEIDSRAIVAGDLFFGLGGERTDGGRFAAAALREGAWGVVVERARAAELVADSATAPGWIFACEQPLAALQDLATEWRRELGCPLVAITGSTGKTTVKDICRAILPGRVHASPENFNTEIGMPLSLLAAPPETDLLVMEMGMRGRGQIAELCAIAEPDVGAITNIGPVHLELLGTLEAIAETKAEILRGLGPEGRAVVPVDAEVLAPHLEDRLTTIAFGAGGDVLALEVERGEGGTTALIGTPAGDVSFDFPFTEAHNLANALCAVAIGVALGCDLEELSRRAPRIEFSRLRGERVRLQRGILLLNDCYNANPVSMRAAVQNLASLETSGRRIAVLGGMAELGPDTARYHAEIAALVRSLGVGPLIGVGDLARDYAPDEWAADPGAAAELVEAMIGTGDIALVKGSRSIGLEAFTDTLRARIGDADGDA